MGKFINPFTDVGFKRIFGQEVSKPLLIDFLNNLLEGERYITDVQFLDKERIPDSKEDRGLIYDVYCMTDTGERIIVEMQNRSQSHFKDRALLYLSKAIVEQGRKGCDGNSYEINAVYGVFFMNFRDTRFEQKFRTDVALVDRQTGSLFSEKLRMIFLQLPEFQKEAEECKTYFERWIYVLKNMEILNRMPWAAQYAAFQRLSQICETAALTPKERSRYEESIKVYRDNLAIAERAEEEGIEKGIEKVAKSMKEDGLPIELIIKHTGLTAEQIEAL